VGREGNGRGLSLPKVNFLVTSLPLLPVTDIDSAFHDVKALVEDDSPSKKRRS